MKNKHTSNNKFNTKKIHKIIHSINVISNQNYFQRNKIYSRKGDFVMGGPLSPLLSKVYMQY